MENDNLLHGQSSRSAGKTDKNITQTDSHSEHKKSPEKKINTYAILMETSGEECESWYYFIKYQGNEDNLKYLQLQLSEVDWYVLDDLCTFDLELDYLVSEQTAKEMTKIDLNHKSFHRKFDGELKRINLGFREKDKTEKKMAKAFDKLGYGQIEDFIDQEDIDEEDLTDASSSEEEDSSVYSSSDESGSESVSEKSSPEEKEKKEEPKKQKKLPPAIRDMPRVAQARRRRAKK